MPPQHEAADLFTTVSPAVRRLLGLDKPEVTRSDDWFPRDGHRVRLEFWWDEALPPLLVVGQNPSKATRHRGDPTVTRCARRSHAMGLGGLVMLNLFSMVATDPADMWAHPTDPMMQALNHQTIAAAFDRYPAAPILFAPGGDKEPRHAAASAEVQALATARGRTLLCLGVTATGAPRHPSRSAYATEAQPWNPAGGAAA